MGIRRIFGLEGNPGATNKYSDLTYIGVDKVVNTTSEGVWLFDLQGRTTFVNRRMADMLGARPDELIGARLMEFLDREDRAAAEHDLHNWLRRSAESRYQHLNRRDGRDLWTRVSSSTIENERNSIVGLLGMFTDATDRREMEDALHRAEGRFRIVFDSSPIGIVVVNLDGYAVLANSMMLNMLGYRREEIQQVSFEHVTHPDDVAEDRRLYASLMKGDIENFRREKRYVTRAGNTLWVHVNASLVRSPDGLPQYAISMVEDVTEKHRAEIALRDSSNQLRHALDAAHMVIWRWDLASDRMEWSENVHRVFQIEPERTPGTGQELVALVVPHDRERVAREIESVFQTPNAKFVSIFQASADQADPRWFEARGEVDRDAAGEPQCMVGAVVDVTARRRAEELLRQSQDRELRSREEFSRHLLTAQEQERQRLANELHDGLGQNLSLIRNRMHLALELPGLTPELAEHLRAVASIASDCVSEVRNLAQNLRPVQIEQLGLTEALNSLVDRVSDAGTTVIESSIEDVDDVMPGEAGTQLYRICQEALTNVLRHSQARHASLTLQRDVAMLRLEIHDDGVGFDPEQRDDASGLGLTSMRERAQMLGGTFEVRSQPGEGTHLHLHLPFTEPAERT